MRLRAVSPSQGMMIETLAARLGEPGGPHAGAPDKTPERRLATLEAAGRARVPFTTGILVGIGETRARAARRARSPSRAAHARHGHVQEVIVQNFLPKPGTSMWRAPACDPDEFLWTDRRRPAGARPVDPPAGAAQPLRRPTTSPRWSPPASTTGAASPRSPPTT